jgi:hypothetical protein
MGTVIYILVSLSCIRLDDLQLIYDDKHLVGYFEF